MTTTKRGGARKGAGRASKDGAIGLRQISTRITDEQRAKAESYGHGDASAGIRAALDALPEVPPAK